MDLALIMVITKTVLRCKMALMRTWKSFSLLVLIVGKYQGLYSKKFLRINGRVGQVTS